MSKHIEPITAMPTFDEMQALIRVSRKLRSEAFAEFFGFGVSSKRKAESKAAEQEGEIRGAAPAGC